MNNFSDIVLELNSLYREKLINNFDKKNKSKIFLSIVGNLFEKYKDVLGYKELSDFKRDLIFYKKSLEEAKKEEKSLLKSENISEGSGVIFTLKQINDFGLNPDSY